MERRCAQISGRNLFLSTSGKPFIISIQFYRIKFLETQVLSNGTIFIENGENCQKDPWVPQPKLGLKSGQVDIFEIHIRAFELHTFEKNKIIWILNSNDLNFL
jgi:hypothetical protein